MNDEEKSGTFPWTILLIVLFIIGILAAIAIPDFLHFNTRAAMSETKVNLISISRAEIAYHAEYKNWSDHFSDIGWEHTGSTRYAYFINPTEYQGKSIDKLGITLPIDFSAYGAPMPGASANGFTAVAIGNVDADESVDVWYIQSDKVMHHPYDDVRE